MTYIVAVSGGVDSVCLLDMLARTNSSQQSSDGIRQLQGATFSRVIVAHVNHGIRDDAAADARFVAGLARQYQKPFVSVELKLGKGASEERARTARYDFLFELAKKHSATLITAHHADDMVETIAINSERGTGWRGLAVLARPGVVRPLLGLTKQQLYDYALEHRLEWVEDSTNQTDAYLRNRLRRVISDRSVDYTVMAQLRAKQLQLRSAIDYEVARINARHRSSRHFLTQIDEQVAMELLGAELQLLMGRRPTRPQLQRALLAVKTGKAGSRHHIGEKIVLQLTARKYQMSVL